MHDDQEKQLDARRRAWLIATSVVGGIGGVATLVPFVGSMEPSERARTGGAPVEVDIGALRPNERITVAWRGLPVWVVRRTPGQMNSLTQVAAQLADPDSRQFYQFETPGYCRNAFRARVEHKEVLVVVGICTHLGCIPNGPFNPGTDPTLGAYAGFVCPCHGSTYDMAGRVFKNKPAPYNLDVPHHMYLSGTRIVIGKDEKGEA